MFFFSNKSKAKRRRLRKKKRNRKAELVRRNTIINEARKIHAKNRKDAEKYLSKGGFTTVSSMEDENLGFKVASAVEKTIQKGGRAMSRLRRREKSLARSRHTHLAKLQAARSKMVARGRV